MPPEVVHDNVVVTLVFLDLFFSGDVMMNDAIRKPSLISDKPAPPDNQMLIGSAIMKLTRKYEVQSTLI